MPTPPHTQPPATGLVRRVVNAVLGRGGAKANPPPMRFPATSGGVGGMSVLNMSSPLSYTIGSVPGGGQSDWDYASEVGDVWVNGAVGAGIRWIGDNFFEPELIVEVKQPDGTWLHDPSNVAANEAAALVLDPNPDYDGDALCSALSLAYFANGLGYAVKARAKAGRKMYLYFVPWWQIKPVWPSDGSKFVSGYKQTVDGIDRPLAKEDVVVIRKGIDPSNPRAGLAPLSTVMPDISADNAGSLYGATILRNLGIPGAIIQPEGEDATFDDVSRRQLGDEWQYQTTGENRFRPIVSSNRIKVDVIGLAPEKMALDTLRSIPEERICAAIGLSPMVLNLPSGKNSKSYANYGEARRAAYHDCLIPLQKAFARSLTRQLLPDFGFAPGTARFVWDYSKVEAVSDDQDAKVKRELAKLTAGLSLRSQTLSALGMPVADDRSDEVRYVPKNLIVIHADNTPVESLNAVPSSPDPSIVGEPSTPPGDAADTTPENDPNGDNADAQE